MAKKYGKKTTRTPSRRVRVTFKAEGKKVSFLVKRKRKK